MYHFSTSRTDYFSSLSYENKPLPAIAFKAHWGNGHTQRLFTMHEPGFVLFVILDILKVSV